MDQVDRQGHKQPGLIDRAAAVVGLGGLFAIGYVLFTDGTSGIYQVGGDAGFLFKGSDVLIIAILLVVGAAMLTRARTQGRAGVVAWLVLVAAGALFVARGVTPEQAGSLVVGL